MWKDIPQIKELRTSAYTIPTDYPESDGTLQWDSTTMVLVEILGGNETGLGYTYADAGVAVFIEKTLKPIVLGLDCFNIPVIRGAMITAGRNNGNEGMAAMGLSAVDHALWDLKAKLLAVPLALLLGMKRERVPIYGSGGFTSYPVDRLQKQLAAWVGEGIGRVKMKIGREPEKDLYRVKMARQAIGDYAQLFVDANGAYGVKQAVDMANQFKDEGITWLEEPVPSSNLKGLEFIRKEIPPPMVVAAGEYGGRLAYFKQMLDADAVDVLQADATRCGGLTGFLQAGYLCEADQRPFSSHCAPALHVAPALALTTFTVSEFFHDHARIEKIFFDGFPQPKDGAVQADLSRTGHGLEFKKADAEKYRIR